MTQYRRWRRNGATYFFTVNLADRSAAALVDHIDQLRAAVRVTRHERPFQINAAVIMPNHLHTIWTLPHDDSDFSTRWRLIKTRFSRSLGAKQPVGRSQREKKECGIWQRRFWEHMIRDDADYANHLQYCWENPVKHGFVTRAVDWPYSSLHRDMRLANRFCGDG
ncbi:REP-associated tyrosine transposase [Yoonia tamlensis]|nr:transposase [Yoonia tamlensis]